MQFEVRTLLAAVITAFLASAAAAQTASEPTVVDRVGNAVKRGASAAERGIEKGVGAAASGVKRAASAAERGARKASGAVERTAERIGLPTSGASSPK
jgi:parvulin-like peptidyl-prolyl isomerase